MCEPISTATALTIASIATSAAGSVVGYIGANQQAQEQQRYQDQMAAARNKQIQENNALVTRNFNNQTAQENLRRQQEAAKASQDITEKNKQVRQAQARAMVSAGEAGVSGLSIDGLLADFDRQGGLFRDSVRQNEEFRSIQSKQDLEAYQQQAIGRAQSIQPYIPTPVTRPSFLGTALEIGVGAVDRYSAYQERTRQRPQG